MSSPAPVNPVDSLEENERLRARVLEPELAHYSSRGEIPDDDWTMTTEALPHERLYRAIGESLDYGVWVCHSRRLGRVAALRRSQPPHGLVRRIPIHRSRSQSAAPRAALPSAHWRRGEEVVATPYPSGNRRMAPWEVKSTKALNWKKERRHSVDRVGVSVMEPRGAAR